MGTRQDRLLWNAVWSRSTRMKITPRQFHEHLESASSPWICYNNAEGVQKSVLEALCSGGRSDFQVMLSSWIKKAMPLDSWPSSHPPPLHCLPVDASLSSLEKLVSAGAGPVDRDVASHYLSRGITSQSGLSSRGFWLLMKDMLDQSGTPISSLRLPGCDSTRETLMAIWNGGLKSDTPDEGLEVLLSDGGWDLSWKENSPYGEWVKAFLCAVISRSESASTLLSSSGLDWTGVDAEGNTLAHILVLKTTFSYDGKETLPIDALRHCIENGVDFYQDNVHGWNVKQRMNAIGWSNEKDMEPLLSDLRRQRLHESTVATSGAKTPSRRI